MGQSGDDVDGEADQKGSHSGVDGAEEWENDGQKPYGYDHRQASHGSRANTPSVMHSYHFFPYEVQWGAREPECDELPHY